MPNRFFINLIDLVAGARARAGDVEANFNQVEAGFDQVQTELNAVQSLEYGSYVATSTTNNTIEASLKTFTVEMNKGFVTGQFVVAASTASPGNYVLGQVASYSATTGVLVINGTSSQGSGAFSQWSISVASAPMESGIQQFLFINQGVI